MSSARPEIAARAVALVEPDEVARECVARALEGSQLQIVSRCASVEELSGRLSSGLNVSAILIGNDRGWAAFEPEEKRLRELFGGRTIVTLSFRQVCRGILGARNESESAPATAALAHALEWVVLGQQNARPTAGQSEAASGGEPPDVRSHIKALLESFGASDSGIVLRRGE